MALSFYPWQPGQVIKAEDLNELVESIQNGSVFQNTTYVTEQLNTNDTRINGLEDRVTYLETLQGLFNIREQFVLTTGQALVNLSKVPALDTEIPALNGLLLAKTAVPIGFTGDYSLSGSTLNFNVELSSQIVDGDVLVVVYRYAP